MVYFETQNRLKKETKIRIILGSIFGLSLAGFGGQTGPGRPTIARKISFGEVLGRLGTAALRFWPFWFRFGALSGRPRDHARLILDPSVGSKLGFGTDFVPKMTLKSDFRLLFVVGCLSNQSKRPAD